MLSTSVLRRSSWLASASMALGFTLFASASMQRTHLGLERLPTAVPAVLGHGGTGDGRPSRPHAVAFATVRRAFVDLNWTGALAAQQRDPLPRPGPTPTRPSLDELLQLLMIQIDTRDPAASRVHARRIADGHHLVLRAGERVPLAGTLVRVHLISPDSVEFELDEGERECVALSGAHEDAVAIPVLEVR